MALSFGRCVSQRVFAHSTQPFGLWSFGVLAARSTSIKFGHSGGGILHCMQEVAMERLHSATGRWYQLEWRRVNGEGVGRELGRSLVWWFSAFERLDDLGQEAATAEQATTWWRLRRLATASWLRLRSWRPSLAPLKVALARFRCLCITTPRARFSCIGRGVAMSRCPTR